VCGENFSGAAGTRQLRCSLRHGGRLPGRSFYTYRWRPVAGLQTHITVFDDALFKVDWSQRPRTGLDASQVQFFLTPQPSRAG
jgi:hypothetical protein